MILITLTCQLRIEIDTTNPENRGYKSGQYRSVGTTTGECRRARTTGGITSGCTMVCVSCITLN